MNSIAAVREFRSAARVQGALTARAEKAALIWMAERTPRAVTADHLTLLGFGAQLLAGVSFALARWDRYALFAVIFFIALNWLGDSLDGTLARYRQCQRPRYGFYVDHMVDAFGALFLLAGLALSGYMSPSVAWALLIAFLLLSVDSYLATYTLGTFRISIWKFSPTEMRILLAVGNAYAFLHPQVTMLGRKLLFFDAGGMIACAGMAVILLFSVSRNTATLYLEEQVPGR